MSKIYLFVILILLPLGVSAQSFSISGTVQDKATGETLIGAAIFSKESGKGITTNEYGFFSLSLKEGKHTIVVSYVGYKKYTKEINLVKSQKFNVQMEANSSLDEVVVYAEENIKSQTKQVIAGSVKLKPQDIKQIPALLGEPDINRVILTQPGVSSVGEGSSGFNIRGGNIDQNLILLDEAPIYNSSHVWGFFSVFNADAIKNMQLYKGGIPARFGGRASSVLDVRQREGSTKQFKGEGGIGLLFSRLTLETPIVKDKLSFLVSGRRSYFDLFFPLIKDLKKTKVYFYDLNSKISWNINENNRLYFSGYFGADAMKLKFEEEQDDNSKSKSDESIDFQWKNATATVRWNHIFSDKLFMNLSGIYSNYNYKLASKNSGGPTGGSSSSSFTWKSSIENWIMKSDFTFYKDANTKVRFGINSTLYRFVPAKVVGNEAGINSINFGTEKGIEAAPYLSYEREIGNFSINAGLRYSWFGNIGSDKVYYYNPKLPKTVGTITGSKKYKENEIIKSYNYLEPRLAIKYDLSDRNSFKFGYNRMIQYINLISNTNATLPFDIWKPAGYHIKPLEVNQISLGYAHDTKESKYNFSADTYYKTFKNQVEYKNGADLFLNEKLETQLLPSDGYSYGLELGIFKTKGRVTGNANYTYSVTRRKTTSKFLSENINDGKYYPSNYDRPHIFNLTANIKLSKNWSLGTFFTYQTGRPTTYTIGKFELDGKQFFSYSDRNAYRLKDTHRLDISFTWSPERKKDKWWSGSWVFGVYNVYSHKNAFSTYSSMKNNKLKTYQFSVIGAPIPFVTYNFKF